VKQQHPVIERYMTHLETAIGGLDPADRREVLQEIRNHIAEATAAGKSLDVVLESLGPADALAARGASRNHADIDVTVSVRSA
jgi:uncharacterized membrane protein